MRATRARTLSRLNTVAEGVRGQPLRRLSSMREVLASGTSESTRELSLSEDAANAGEP